MKRELKIGRDVGMEIIIREIECGSSARNIINDVQRGMLRYGLIGNKKYQVWYVGRIDESINELIDNGTISSYYSPKNYVEKKLSQGKDGYYIMKQMNIRQTAFLETFSDCKISEEVKVEIATNATVDMIKRDYNNKFIKERTNSYTERFNMETDPEKIIDRAHFIIENQEIPNSASV